EGGPQADLNWREGSKSRRSRSRHSPRDRAICHCSFRRDLLGYSLALMIRQAVLELPWDTLVEEYSHQSWPTSADLASSNEEMAALRVTVGKSSTNSSKVCPPSR